MDSVNNTEVEKDSVYGKYLVYRKDESKSLSDSWRLLVPKRTTNGKRYDLHVMCMNSLSRSCSPAALQFGLA